MDSIADQAKDADADADPILNLDYRRYVAALRKYVWLIAATIALAVAGAVIYTARQTPIYEATASIQIEPRLPDLLGTGDLFNLAAGGGSPAEYYNQQKVVIGSYMLAQKTVQQNDLVPKLLGTLERGELSETEQLDRATRRLQHAITVRYPKPDRVMYISVRNSDAELAQAIANAHVATYENYTKGLLTLSSGAASEALQTEFLEVESKLRAAEEKIYKFQAENDMLVMTLEDRQSLVSQNILSFTQKLNDSRANEFDLASRLAQIRKESTSDVLETPIVMLGHNPSFETLRAQYYVEKTKLLELEKDLGPKNPDYIVQKQKVDELLHGLQGEVKIVADGTEDLHAAARMTSQSLASEVEKYKQEARLLGPKIVQYNELKREKQEIEDRYNILRTRLSATQMTGSMSSIISNVRKLDPALRPAHPVSPSMRINVAIGAIGALFLSIGIVFLIVFLDRTIKTTADATQAVGAPVLGVIPILDASELDASNERARDLVVHAKPKSAVAECCRALRTNVLFSAADRQLKTLAICSANPQEGKTTSVIYLGTTLAQSNQRVLLIDTDMHRPRLHVSLNVPRERGLSNLILGDDSYDAVICATEIPNLFVLPCGPLPPNPAELLMTKRFETVLAELTTRFDRVILDSPPVQLKTDAVVLSRRVDGVIMVVRASRTLRDDLKRSSRQIRDVGGHVIGTIVNEIDGSEREGYYGYYSYGYYGYDAAA